MRIQKCHIGYCTALWALWSIAFIFITFAGLNRDFYSVSMYIANITIWVTLIPIHWVLGIWALVSATNRQQTKRRYLNVITLYANALGGILMLMLCISHVN